MDGVICSQGDISIACNKIEKYLEGLSTDMALYIKVLSNVQQDAIRDHEIDAALSELAKKVQIQAVALKYFYDDYVKMTASREISEIKAADSFNFPNELMAKISSFLAMFLGG